MATRGPQNGRRGLERGSTLGYWPFLATFAKFFDPSTPSMRKGTMENGKKKMENKGENRGPLTSLPVDRLTATDCKADSSYQKLNKVLDI